METSLKKCLHVVVGAGIPEYMINAVESILDNTTDDILGLYNSTGEMDVLSEEWVTKITASGRAQIRHRKNVVGGKTGSLYAANNEAIAFAIGKYQLISFTQSDMQLMWWSENILRLSEDLLINSNRTQRRSLLCLYSQIPVRGKRRDFYGLWNSEMQSSSLGVPGIVDVAMFSVEGIVASGFYFHGTEKDMMTYSAKAGWRTLLHPIPFLAPIPFPASVRRGVRHERRYPTILEGTKLLRVSEAFDLTRVSGSGSLHPIFMEDCVFPNGWNALTPFWPSDTLDLQWFERRVDAIGLLRSLLPEVMDGKNGKIGVALLRNFAPGIMSFIHSALMVTFRKGLAALRSTFTPGQGLRVWASNFLQNQNSGPSVGP